MKYNFLHIFWFFLLSSNTFGQDTKTVDNNFIETFKLDGVLDEPLYDLVPASNFYQYFPNDSSSAILQTKVWTAHDEHYLYIGAYCIDDLSKKFTIQSLTRDFDLFSNDMFALVISPLNDKTNGVYFALTPHGTQHEGSIEYGGAFGGGPEWDNKWYSATVVTDSSWTLEMKIPFKTIRYNPKNMEWGVNFVRTNLKHNEITVWNKVPQNFNFLSLANVGTMQWTSPPPAAGRNLSVIPYGITGFSKDYQANSSTYKYNLGLDAKIAVSSSLNLDLTINPDFSQVDVDVQITNLSRFSLFFPERRQFFLENSDIFERFGFSKIRPFFSRQIGLSNGQTVPIIAGARLSGSINKNWRIGIMDLQTEGSIHGPAQNFAVGAIQRRVGNWGNIAFITVNRQDFDNFSPIANTFNRIFGLDYNLQSPNGKHRGKFFYHQSISPSKSDYTHASWYMYNTRNLTFHWNHEYVGKDYRADVGFVPRVQNYNSETNEFEYRTYWRLEPSITYRHYTKGGKINYIAPEIYFSEYYDNKFVPTETRLAPSLYIKMKDQSFFSLTGGYNQVRLLFDTDITFSENPKHTAGFYHFNDITGYYSSSPINLLNYEVELTYGQYYTGHKFSSAASVAFRIQPRFKLSTSIEYNNIYFDQIYNDVQLLILSPRIDYQFNNKMFFTTFIQYNTQVENININARFQYRFKPMSDLFIVYTDNYNSNIFGIKNRAMVIKLVWWLNV
ncbi:MAG: carbohydrate binding family 9 domain-containing protein [Flavobacteriales bacterium]|nr:carbohydrate binding family 9 domain-containing protein [Flavobacteriales bacterium]